MRLAACSIGNAAFSGMQLSALATKYSAHVPSRSARAVRRRLVSQKPAAQESAAGGNDCAGPFPTGHRGQLFERSVFTLQQQQVGRITRRRRNLHQYLAASRPRHRSLQHLQPSNCVSNLFAVLAKHHGVHFFRDFVQHASKIQCTPLAPREAFCSQDELITLMLLATHFATLASKSQSRSTMRFTNLIIMSILLITPTRADQTAVWIGMSAPTHGEREGIYRATLDTTTGALTQPNLAAEIGMPEFLALHPNGKRLYAACRLPNGDGGVAAYEISDDTSSLRLLNAVPTGGGQSCHVAVDRSGHCLFSAQYGGGSVSALPLAPDGKILSAPTVIRHAGSGPNQKRQEGPHPHFVGTDPENHYLFVPDLGRIGSSSTS